MNTVQRRGDSKFKEPRSAHQMTARAFAVGGPMRLILEVDGDGRVNFTHWEPENFSLARRHFTDHAAALMDRAVELLASLRFPDERFSPEHRIALENLSASEAAGNLRDAIGDLRPLMQIVRYNDSEQPQPIRESA